MKTAADELTILDVIPSIHPRTKHCRLVNGNLTRHRLGTNEHQHRRPKQEHLGFHGWFRLEHSSTLGGTKSSRVSVTLTDLTATMKSVVVTTAAPAASIVIVVQQQARIVCSLRRNHCGLKCNRWKP